jgi:hypothetical protein
MSRSAPVWTVLVLIACVASAEVHAANGATSAAARCTKPAPTTAAGFLALIQNAPFPWISGDTGVQPIDLQDGRFFWSMNDVYLGVRTASGAVDRTRSVLVNTAPLIQDRGCLTARFSGPASRYT